MPIAMINTITQPMPQPQGMRCRRRWWQHPGLAGVTRTPRQLEQHAKGGKAGLHQGRRGCTTAGAQRLPRRGEQPLPNNPPARLSKNKPVCICTSVKIKREGKNTRDIGETTKIDKKGPE